MTIEPVELAPWFLVVGGAERCIYPRCGPTSQRPVEWEDQAMNKPRDREMIKTRLLTVITTIMASSALAKEPIEVKVVPPRCVTTRVAKIHPAQKLEPGEKEEPVEGEPGSFFRCGACAGSMEYTNNIWHITAYRRVPAMEESRKGDVVTYCLVSKYIYCPKGDDRGKTYLVKNHRTGKTWNATNGSHICGGA